MTTLGIVVVTATIIMLLTSVVMMALKEQFLTQDRWYWNLITIMWYACAITVVGGVLYRGWS